jgi:hypothetical protein
MTITTAQTSSRRSGASARLKAAVLTVALGLSLTAGNVQAQAVVEIGGNLFTNIMNQVNTALTQVEAVGEYAETASRWTRELQQFRDMMNSIDSMVSTLGLPMGVNLKKVPENFMVAEKCGGNPGDLGGILSSALGSLVGVSLEGKIKQQQMEVCVSAQRMRNRQYNEMVDYMTTTMGQMNSMKSLLANFRGTGTRTSGQMDGAIYEVQKTNGEMEQAKSEFESRMKAYDTYIAAMDKTQAVLAQTTLRGKPSIMGEVIKTAALATALKVGN